MGYKKDFITDSINTISGAGYCLSMPDVLSFQPGAKAGWSAWSLSAGKIVMQPKNTRYQFTPDIYFQSVGGSDDARPLNIQVEIAVDMFIRAAAGSPDLVNFETRAPGSYMANMAAAGCAFLRRSQKRYSFRHVGAGLYVCDEIRPDLLIDINPDDLGLSAGVDLAFFPLVNWRVYALGLADRQTLTGTARFFLDGFFLSSEQYKEFTISYEMYGINPLEWIINVESGEDVVEIQKAADLPNNSISGYDAAKKAVFLTNFKPVLNHGEFFVYLPMSANGSISYYCGFEIEIGLKRIYKNNVVNALNGYIWCNNDVLYEHSGSFENNFFKNNDNVNAWGIGTTFNATLGIDGKIVGRMIL